MNVFFQTLHRALRDKENFRFQVTRDGEQLRVVIQPLLGDKSDTIDEESPDDSAQVRAALALPLLLQDFPATLDQQFAERISQFGEARAPLQDSFTQLIDNLKEADKNAKNTLSKTQKTIKASAKKPESQSARPDPDADDAVTEKESVATPAAPSTMATTPVDSSNQQLSVL